MVIMKAAVNVAAQYFKLREVLYYFIMVFNYVVFLNLLF